MTGPNDDTEWKLRMYDTLSRVCGRHPANGGQCDCIPTWHCTYCACPTCAPELHPSPTPDGHPHLEETTAA